ncbi:RVP_2 domain-containing protein [Cucumis melo var. makuwa]|uniref:RVP_2 domain-containing protein n=1 Tax=Cucumis melo var. makuwa TaxID=1194695 RepID=A0A5D3BVI4_CUCMM|nr:RVP_2 domain-containing protein [Cucumis melo var. makuwa]
MSYGSVFQRQSQRIPSQSIRSTVRQQPGHEFVANTVGRTPYTSCGKNHQVQKDQGVGSQIVEKSRVSVFLIEGTNGASIFLTKLNIMLELLSEWLAIYTPVGDVLLVNDVLRNCEVLGEGISMLVDLIPLELQRLYVILGMNFLFTHYASMDCHRKEVVLRKPGFSQVVFRGIWKFVPRSLILILRAEKLLRKGCTTFHAHVVVVQREKLKPEDVPEVKEFLDVFPNDLSGLPPNREIEFIIELLPRRTPISQDPYRMAPSELKELKVSFVLIPRDPLFLIFTIAIVRTPSAVPVLTIAVVCTQSPSSRPHAISRNRCRPHVVCTPNPTLVRSAACPTRCVRLLYGGG